MVTAEIAWQQLTERAAHDVQAILATFDAFDKPTRSLAASAVWPDREKAARVVLFNEWHYKDVPYVDGVDDAPEPENDNLVWALEHCESMLRNDDTDAFGRALCLRLVIHFVGDAHQPLHCVSRFSPAHPDGDIGGNAVQVTDTRHSDVHNLHSFWDSGAGIFDEWENVDDDAMLTAEGLAYVERIAKDFIRDEPASSFAQDEVESSDFQAWVDDGYQKSVDTVYSDAVREADTDERVPMTDEYRAAAVAIVRRNIALGGHRLAHLLNDIFSDDRPAGPEDEAGVETDEDGDGDGDGSPRSAVALLAVLVVVLGASLVFTAYGWYRARKTISADARHVDDSAFAGLEMAESGAVRPSTTVANDRDSPLIRGRDGPAGPERLDL